MRYYKFNLNNLLKVVLLEKETLIPPRMHYTRYINEYIMYVVVNGSLKMSINGEPVTLRPQGIYIFKAGDFQMPLECSFCEYFYIHFKSDSVEELDITEEKYTEFLKEKIDKQFKIPYYSSQCYSLMHTYVRSENHISSKSLFDYILNILKNNVVHYDARVPEKRFEISAAVASIIFKLESFEKHSVDKSYEQVRKIVDYIEKNYAANFCGADIEKEFFLNFDYANRIFKKAMGCSIIKYRNTIRIQNAKALMRSTSMSLKEIATETGFENVYYFSRIFKKSAGSSPAEYRQKFLHEHKE